MLDGVDVDALLPANVREMAEVIGTHAALKLVDAAFARSEANGSDVTRKRSWRAFAYIPATNRPEWIVSAIGKEKAEDLREVFANTILELSNCGRLVVALRREARRSLRDLGFPELIIRRVVVRSNLAGRAKAASPEASPSLGE